MTNSHFSLAFLSAALVLSAAPLALAQPDNPPLKGPDVTDRPPARGKAKSSFGGDAAGKNKARPQLAPPMPAFMKALDAANLTNDQSSKAKAFAADFDKAGAAFRENHKAEIDAARAKLSQTDRDALDKMLESGRPLKASKAGFQGKRKALGKGKGGEDSESMTDKPDAPSNKAASEDAAEARAKLLEIYSQRPKPEETQTKIFALLNDKQTQAVETHLKQLAESRRGKGPGKGKGEGNAPRPGKGKA